MSENFFGILTNRFEIYRAPIRLSPEKAVNVIYTTLCLHNWLLVKMDPSFDVKEPQRNEPHNQSTQHNFQGALQPIIIDPDDNSNSAESMREDLNNWFNGEGWRNWQIHKI